jgi:hypothetical protein
VADGAARPVRAPSRWREWLLAAVGLGAVPALLLLVEGALGVAERAGLDAAAPPPLHRLHRYSESLGWEPRPGARFASAGVTVSINERGCRGRPVAPERRARRTRIVLLGDSIAFGLGVNDGETFAGLLDAPAAGREVVNLAVQGYGPDQSLLRLEREGPSYRPDLVVFSLCLGNDFADAVLPVSLYDGRHPKPYFTLERDALVEHHDQLRLARRQQLSLWLAERSRLFRWLSAPRPAAGAGAESWLARRRAALSDRRRALELVAALVARMQDVARAAGADFVVLVHPDRELIEGRAAWRAGLFTAPRLAAVRMVDLRERYARRGLAYADWAADRIGHLSRAGHLHTALVVEEVLEEAGVARRGAARVG